MQYIWYNKGKYPTSFRFGALKCAMFLTSMNNPVWFKMYVCTIPLYALLFFS